MYKKKRHRKMESKLDESEHGEIKTNLYDGIDLYNFKNDED